MLSAGCKNISDLNNVRNMETKQKTVTVEIPEGNCSSRLAYKLKELAEYAGTQFSSVYARFYFGEKAIGAMPWREFEKKRKSRGNK